MRLYSLSWAQQSELKLVHTVIIIPLIRLTCSLLGVCHIKEGCRHIKRRNRERGGSRKALSCRSWAETKVEISKHTHLQSPAVIQLFNISCLKPRFVKVLDHGPFGNMPGRHEWKSLIGRVQWQKQLCSDRNSCIACWRHPDSVPGSISHSW